MRQRLVLGGPAMSWSDVVATTEQILGRPVAVESLAPGSPIPTLPPPLDRAIGALAAGLEQQDVIIDATEIARTFGVSLTPSETVLRRMLERQG
jgi:hypothetical protein